MRERIAGCEPLWTSYFVSFVAEDTKEELAKSGINESNIGNYLQASSAKNRGLPKTDVSESSIVDFIQVVSWTLAKEKTTPKAIALGKHARTERIRRAYGLQPESMMPYPKHVACLSAS